MYLVIGKCVTVLILLNFLHNYLRNHSFWEYRHVWLYRCNLTYVPRNSLPECGRFILNLLYTNVSWLSVVIWCEYWSNIFKSSPYVSLSIHYFRHSLTCAVVTSGRSAQVIFFTNRNWVCMRMYMLGCLVKIQNSSTLEHGDPQNDGSAACVIDHQ